MRIETLYAPDTTTASCSCGWSIKSQGGDESSRSAVKSAVTAHEATHEASE